MALHLGRHSALGRGVYLEDLERLPRGDASNPSAWEQFVSDARVRSLRWPDSVVRQFLFDHGRNSGFMEQYGHLDLASITWRMEQLSAEVVAAASTFSEFDWADTVEANFEYYLVLRTPAERASWVDRGTWIEPPLLIRGSAVHQPAAEWHLVEGHTRLGMLRAHLARALVLPEAVHHVWVGR